jgi:hypothetical protein
VPPSRRVVLRAAIAACGLAVVGCSPTKPAAGASTRRTDPAAQDTAGLQAALAAEHVAVYGYGVAGAWLAGAPRRAALAALDAHRVRRDQLIEMLRARGVAPVPAAAAYELPFPVHDASSAARLAARLEAGTAKAARALAGAADPALRGFADRLLADATARQATWRRLSG